jgi:endonuclease/exonuclease/phosphatase (EEP) superfamily protein YafD
MGLIFFTSDLYSPLLFIVKAAYFQLAIILSFTGLIILGLNKSTFIKILISSLIFLLLIPLLSQYQNNHNIANTKTAITVASFSALTRTRNGNDIFNFSKQYNPDILCLQEVLEEDIHSLKKIYPYYVHNGNSTLSIFSHLPLTQKSANGTVQVSEVFTEKNNSILLFNVHLPRQYQHKSYYENGWGTFLPAINEAVDNQKIILCGDFNMTPYNTMHGIITKTLHFVDAHQSGGDNMGFTFPSGARNMSLFGAQLRIDYIFAKGFTILSTTTITVSASSDHNAVLTNMSLEQEDNL